MYEKMSTNVLVIGKSGVGKSSLLNYIFNAKVEETGAGRPVTSEGIFNHAYEYDENLTINIYDTWGLEANKSFEWKKIITDEISRHDCSTVKDWFHTIIYCFSAKSARIEDFEIELIQELLLSGNKITVALTHCDAFNVENAILEMTKQLVKIGVDANNVINVCNVDKKLLGGKITKPFGLEELFYSIKNNFAKTIISKLPRIVNEKLERALNQWEDNCFLYIDKNVNIFNSGKSKTFSKVNEYTSQTLKGVIKGIENYCNDTISDSISYFIKLSEKLYLTNQSIDKKIILINISIKYSIGLDERLSEFVAQIILILTPGLNMLLPARMRDIRKDKIKKLISEAKNDLLEETSIQVTNYLKSINLQ